MNHDSQVITPYNQLLFKKGLIGPNITSTGTWSLTSKFDFGHNSIYFFGINRLKSTCDRHVICPFKGQGTRSYGTMRKILFVNEWKPHRAFQKK